MQWIGPFEVVERVGITDYKVKLESGVKVFHIYLLKQYLHDDDVKVEDRFSAVLEEDGTDPLEIHLLSSVVTTHETVADVHVCPEFTYKQKGDLHKLLNEFSVIFTDTPGEFVGDIGHRIQLTDNQPIRCKPYPVPHNLRDAVKSEVQEMCRLGVIERSKSPYCSPMLLVKKKDGTNRPVVDFKKTKQIDGV